ncbi:uncharacterized protein IL334_007613 [Kwoniella shivajii]|uniref:Uncharacterized protein n=1 Tax=Kwoniella shivajii TaxID=564305 RepID=A0ABZ1D951_9TREE|nr:hypothetical protein IL334_007613 [Kwoniella shivajii]
MGGPNLEIFRFGFYMFFPIYAMVKFGDPEWYESYVQPYKEILWPPYESTYQPPRTQTGIKEELARMKAERIAKKTGRPIESISQDEIDSEGGVNLNLNRPKPALTSSIPSSSPSSTGTNHQYSSENNNNASTTKMTGTGTAWNWPNSQNGNVEGERLV